jgi:3-methyl-2-oxobutanoate hydroxymethyltransferase
MGKKVTLATLKQLKQQKKPIAVLTCYDYSTAVLLQEAGVDCLMVGDTLAEVILGYCNTLPASMDVMIELTAAVRRGGPDVYLIGDMPFLSYQVSTEKAIVNAGRFLTEAGADAVKLEVDSRHLELVEKLCRAGIPVMAHLGHRPQSVYQDEKIVATRCAHRACQLVQDCMAMVEAGAVSLLLECVADVVAKVVAQQVCVPVISCGSGSYCDGQVLVLHDMLGLGKGETGRFIKAYGNIGNQIILAAGKYVEEVRAGEFPGDEHSYHMQPEQEQEFKKWLAEALNPKH